MTIPTVPTTMDVSAWYLFDAQMRVDRAQADDAYRIKLLAQEERRSAALEAQAAAMRYMADTQTANLRKLDGYTDRELVAMWMSHLAGSWGAGTTPAEIAAVAQGMLPGYRKLYPYVEPTP